VGFVGDCYDNAMVESLFSTLEGELLDRYRLETQGEARMAVFRYIEGWYNPRRRHSTLGYESPVNFGKLHSDAAKTGPSQSAEHAATSVEASLLLLPAGKGHTQGLGYR
jgi:putative transposase